MAEDRVRLDRDGHVATLTLNRPEELNAFSEPPMIEAFLERLSEIKADRDIRAVVLTGAGKAFSAGGNVKHMRDKTDMFAGGPASIRDAYLDGILKVPPAFYGLDRPVIAAVNGAAYGAALDLVCMCDIRLASPDAKFGAPFVKIGIAPGDGAAWFLPRVIGPSNAAEMLFTGEPVGAERALEMGLLGRIVPSPDLVKEAQALAGKIAVNAPTALRLTKRLMREGANQSLDSHLQLCAAYQAILHGTGDHEEAINAFFEKRTPRFTSG